MLGKTDTGTPPGLEPREQLVKYSCFQGGPGWLDTSAAERFGYIIVPFQCRVSEPLRSTSHATLSTSRPRFHGCAPGAVGHETWNSSWRGYPRRPEHVTRFLVDEIRALGSREPCWERSDCEDSSADLDASHDRGGSLRLIYRDVRATRYQPEAGPGVGHKINSRH